MCVCEDVCRENIFQYLIRLYSIAIYRIVDVSSLAKKRSWGTNKKGVHINVELMAGCIPHRQGLTQFKESLTQFKESLTNSLLYILSYFWHMVLTFIQKFWSDWVDIYCFLYGLLGESGRGVTYIFYSRVISSEKCMHL